MKELLYRIIALDLDGTLLNDRKEISPRTYRALAEAHRMGAEIVPSTGRIYNTLPETVARLPFLRYIIEANGAQVYDIREHKVLHQALLDLDKAMEIYRYLDEIDCIYDCYLDGKGYCPAAFYAIAEKYTSDGYDTAHFLGTRSPLSDYKSALIARGEALQKISIFFQHREEKIPVMEALTNRFPWAAISTSVPNNIEINSSLATKGEAIRFLCRHLGTDLDHVIAFGDSINDLDAIRTAGTGVAMGNALPIVKEAADIVTGTNEQDGIAMVLEEKMLSCV